MCIQSLIFFSLNLRGGKHKTHRFSTTDEARGTWPSLAYLTERHPSAYLMNNKCHGPSSWRPYNNTFFPSLTSYVRPKPLYLFPMHHSFYFKLAMCIDLYQRVDQHHKKGEMQSLSAIYGSVLIIEPFVDLP